MLNLYGYRMVNAEGRDLYDLLKIHSTTCLLCGVRTTFELDHFLPKSIFWIYAITPKNLLPSCSECNKLKSEKNPHDPENRFIHPFFDDLHSDFPWLRSVIVFEQEVPTVQFYIEPDPAWSAALRTRVMNHFEKLELSNLYSKTAEPTVRSMRVELARLWISGGDEIGGLLVRDRLLDRHKSSIIEYSINHWTSATFAALANSEEYCDAYFDPRISGFDPGNVESQ